MDKDTVYMCVFFCVCMYIYIHYLSMRCCAVLSCAVMANSLWTHGLQPARLSLSMGFSRQEYCSGLPCPPLQGIFLTQGLNPGLPHCRRILYRRSHYGSPRTLEWVAYPFSRGSSRPRNQTGVSCIAGGFFTSWATREALYIWYVYIKEQNFAIYSNMNGLGGRYAKWYKSDRERQILYGIT